MLYIFLGSPQKIIITTQKITELYPLSDLEILKSDTFNSYRNNGCGIVFHKHN